MKKIFSKVVPLTLALCLYSTVSIAKSSDKNFSGKYTLRQIINSKGETKAFAYGGELIVKDDIATLKTTSQQEKWSLKGLDCKIINNELHQIDAKTGDKYIFAKLD